jgi:hypothetical protein
MDYINFTDSIGYIFLHDGKLPDFKHTVFYTHVKYNVQVVGCDVEKDDFIVRAIADFKAWRFETFKVIEVEDGVAYLNEVDKTECDIGVDEPYYAENALYQQVQEYFDDLSVQDCELEYTVPGYNQNSYLELEIPNRTILFESGNAIKIIEKLSEIDYKRNMSYKSKFYCSLKEGMIIASFIDGKIVYKIVQVAHHLAKLTVLRIVDRDFIGQDIANKIDIAMQQQDRYIEENTSLSLALAFEV